jgi:hypothetical protein
MNRSTRVRILLLIAVPPLVAAAASVIGMLLTPDLPEVLAVHWGFDGSVDRTGGIDSFIWIVAALVPLFTAGIVGFSITPLRTGTSRLFVRSVIGMSIWFGVFISLSMYLGVQTQRNVTDVEALSASSAVVPLLVGFGVAVLVAAIGVVLAPDVPATKKLRAEERTLDLAAGEQAYWASTARSGRGVVALPIGAVLVIVAVFTILGLPVWLTIIVGLLLASLVTMLAWHVVVDRRGLTVTGMLGFPRFHIPVENVVAATAIDINAFGEFGGWGVRVGRSGDWGVVVRSGDAIEVERKHGAPFVVTVDDAATGAGLLTSLARRVQ